MQAESNQNTADATQGAPLKKPSFARLFITQFTALLIITGLLWLYGNVVAYSAFVGGLISIGPNIYFARWAFKHTGARAAGLVVGSFYLGETGKFLLTAVLFAVVFVWLKPLNVMVFFSTYIFMMALNWMLALRLLNATGINKN